MTVMEGTLNKWTNVMKGWQYRWFVLDDNSGLLTYYTSKEKMMRGARRGCVRLKGAIIGIDNEDDSTFTITVDHKTFHFQARDAEERENWVCALEDTIFKHGHGSSRIMWDSHRPPPTIKDFDNKVSEADAYLQLMIEQTKQLEDRISTMTDNNEKIKCQLILEHANAMLDNIKHSIVLLQIAKNTAHPVNGIYQPKLESALSDVSAVSAGGDPVIQQGIELGSECIENARRHNRTIGSVSGLIVPAMSYSSSEGEDDFFDANDSLFPTNQAQLPISVIKSFDNDNETSISVAANIQASIHSRPSSIRQDSCISKNSENLDYDALYEDDEEPNVEMESHGSVIRHLLSQVKIGMDLTKVVLPTFILERRSLLEMYADYFAHPDIFVKIADLKDPKERMIQVVKWYLSSYHAGRKSCVAKKPYNPILGEIFKCHWNWDSESILNYDDNDCNDDNDFVNDGPIPWCKKNQLSFIAEQVSHHPPISAFYAEHYNKRISFNANIYTKSKFLGLSVCVYNIGQGIVSVLDYDEEYILTFPNGYGRSILTVPWIELGGTCTINCPKTGYHSKIEFITKPFYGNKKHKIMCEVYEPDDKKPFLSINGEWNGIMEAKWNNNDKETEEFINVNVLPIIKKQVKPISQQENNESRRLWKRVTAGLKFNDIEKATNAKQILEQKQRDEAKQRKDLGLEWQTKLFVKCPQDNWTYVKPLRERLLKTSNT